MRSPMGVVGLRGLRGALTAGCMAVALAGRSAAFDLSQVVAETVPNGLRVLVLEDHTFPVVSVQMLYTVGARDEESGKTGLAHFVEHMAFRASENFPGTDLVSRIYAVGGEWHGYTWIDQTTYFATVPREHWQLLLAIEADRMSRLAIVPGDVEPERGAVLTELESYENDPASVLYDAVVAASFVEHPYRNNTIGWVSDVAAIQAPDIVDFYRRHYRPANAVLAVVGDVAAADVLERARKLFAALPAAEPTPLPRTRESPQRGLRRVELDGAGEHSRFAVAYRAPSAVDPDWPGFLLLREVLGGGAGVNFNQEDFGVRVVSGTRLHGVPAEMTSWLPPTASPYVMVLAGTVPAETDPAALEAAVEERVAALRDTPVGDDELAAARERLAAELIFDLETTEDAAHQLAFYEGIGARQALLELPERIAAVTAADLQRLAREYLQPWQRTIGWFHAGRPIVTADVPAATAPAGGQTVAPARQTARVGKGASTPLATADPRGGSIAALEPPRVGVLRAGLPVAFQHAPASPTVFLRVIVPTTNLETAAAASVDAPIWRHTSLDFRGLEADFSRVVEDARRALDATTVTAPQAVPSEDPAERLHQSLLDQLQLSPTSGPRAPALLVLVGDLEGLPVEELERHFGGLVPGVLPDAAAPAVRERERTVSLAGRGLAQAQLGYAVPAPPPIHPDHLAWRLALYVLTHGYEGRLGVEAIGRRGLLYYVSSSYPTDGHHAWIALEMGVDPQKLDPLRDLVEEKLYELRTSPPTETEIAEAKQYLLGRRLSAYQSNEEISGFLAREWIGRGELLTQEQFAAELDRVTRDDVLRILPDFISGAFAVVEVD